MNDIDLLLNDLRTIRSSVKKNIEVLLHNEVELNESLTFRLQLSVYLLSKAEEELKHAHNLAVQLR